MSPDLKKIIPESFMKLQFFLASNKQHKAEKLLREYLFENSIRCKRYEAACGHRHLDKGLT